jgi:hypothetical protein
MRGTIIYYYLFELIFSVVIRFHGVARSSEAEKNQIKSRNLINYRNDILTIRGRYINELIGGTMLQ